MSSFAFVRMNRSLQHNVHVSKGTEAYDAPQSFLEIVVTWNSQKLNRPLWKTKKFYDSPVVQTYGDTAMGKAYGYVNKLLQSKWITDDEYNAFWQVLLSTEFSPEHKSHSCVQYPELANVVINETTEQYRNYTALDIDRLRRQENSLHQTRRSKWELLPYTFADVNAASDALSKSVAAMLALKDLPFYE